MDEQEMADVCEILRLHDEAFKDYLKRHNYGHKSQEGALNISLGNFWDRDGWDTPGDFGKIGVEIYSYVLGPSRIHRFDSTAEALVEVRKWHKEQMESPDD